MNCTGTEYRRMAALRPGLRKGRRSMAALTCGLGVALSGCTTPYEGKYDFYEGWRKAKVEQLVAVGEVTKYDYVDCRRTASPMQLAADRFAAVSYRGVRHYRTRIVAFAAGSALKVGDSVYVNPGRCLAALAALAAPP